MSMTARLFRPGPNNRIERFTAAYAAEAMYPGDWVCVGTTAPTSAGPNGDGTGFGPTTLGSTDYIECVLAAKDVAGAEAMMLGCVRGATINSVSDWSDVSGYAAADGDLLVIQSWGVHPSAHVDAAGAIGDHLALHATTEGMAVGTNTAALGDIGAQLAVASARTRVSASDSFGGVSWVRGN